LKGEVVKLWALAANSRDALARKNVGGWRRRGGTFFGEYRRQVKYTPAMPRRKSAQLARRLFGICTAISALLFIGACGLWLETPSVLSSANAPTVTITTDPYTGVLFNNGRAVFSRQLNDGQEHVYGWSGFGLGTHYDHGGREFFISVDFWIMIVALAALPITWVVLRKLTRPLIETGACRTCGYDLRATPRRCPECGTKPASVIVLPEHRAHRMQSPPAVAARLPTNPG
jgi:hypothetical protein